MKHFGIFLTLFLSVFKQVATAKAIGAVTSDHIQCSAIGREILESGGGSVDAAISTMICIGATNSFASGLGGGGFALVVPTGTTSTRAQSAKFYDFREVAPAAWEGEVSEKGARSVGVPGELAGFWRLHRKYGRIPWRKLFEPTISLCLKGILVTELHIKRYKWIENEEIRKIFQPNGKDYLQIGELFFLPALARTLQRIAKNGIDEFYSAKGATCQSLLKILSAHSSPISLKDFESYKVKIRNPLVSSFGKLTVLTGPPPSAGAIVQRALQIISHCSHPVIHTVIEAMKFAYASRFCLCDPDCAPKTLCSFLERIISPKQAKKDFSRLDPNQTFGTEYYFCKCANHKAHSDGTSHVNVFGPDGIVVSMTCSINVPWGSGIYDTATGIILNNTLDDFSRPRDRNSWNLPPSPHNLPAPGKRPQSSCVPLVLLNPEGRLVCCIGASGGSKIPSSVIFCLANHLLFGMNAKEAVEKPRVHHQLEPNEVVLEQGPGQQELALELEARGHAVRLEDPEKILQAAVSMITLSESGDLEAHNDSRKHSKHALACKNQTLKGLVHGEPQLTEPSDCSLLYSSD